MTTLADFPTAARRKPLPVAIRHGRAFWQRQLRRRIADVEQALATGDDTAAANALRRAKVCQNALDRWDAVEDQAARGVAS